MPCHNDFKFVSYIEILNRVSSYIPSLTRLDKYEFSCPFHKFVSSNILLDLCMTLCTQTYMYSKYFVKWLLLFFVNLICMSSYKYVTLCKCICLNYLIYRRLAVKCSIILDVSHPLEILEDHIVIAISRIRVCLHVHRL